MGRSRLFGVVALLGAFSLLAAACGGGNGGNGGDDPGATDCTWTIGAMGAYSGPYAALGLRIREGTEKAIAEANEAGDLACELDIAAEDSEGSPDKAPALADKLIEDEELVFVSGPYFSGETIATGAKFSQAGIAISGTGTDQTIDEQGFETWFRSVAPDNIQGEVAAQYITNVLQSKTLAVVHDNQQYSKGLADVVIENAGDIVAGGKAFVIDPEESDFSAVVSQIESANPDVVFYGGYYEEAGLLAKQLDEAGVNAVFFSDDGSLDPGFSEGAGAAAEGVLMSCPCVDPNKIPEAKAWVEEMKAEFGEKAPGTFAADMYDTTNIAIDALAEYEGDPEDIEAVRAHIVEHFDNAEGVQGIAKSYTWNEDGEFEGGPEDIWIYEFKADGSFSSLGPAQELIEKAGA